jgi:hypothetical protein
MFRASALVSAAAIVFGGCASLMSGPSQHVDLSPSPPDARLYVDGQATAAGRVQLERARSHSIRVERDGFEARSENIETGMNPWVFGNLILGPLFFVGIFVDAVSGAISRLSPDEMRLELAPKRSVKPKAPEPAPVAAAVKEPPPPDWIVAVMNMHGAEEERLLVGLSDQMRVFLAARRVRVVDRGAQQAAFRALLEEEKARSYDGCFDETCQIPLGKALAATHILRSSLARFGTTCATSGELVDLEQEVTVAAGSVRSGCEEEALLAATERLSEELIRQSVILDLRVERR